MDVFVVLNFLPIIKLLAFFHFTRYLRALTDEHIYINSFRVFLIICFNNFKTNECNCKYENKIQNHVIPNEDELQKTCKL